MTIYAKYIVTHEAAGTEFGNAFIVPNNYDHSLGGYDKLFAEAKKSFPGLSRESAECRTVIKSSHCEGMPVLRFPCEPHKQATGWRNVDRLSDMVMA